MKLIELLKQPDTYYVAESRGKISDSEYLSQSELIYSDAVFEHHIRADGYIKISKIQLTVNYIVFLDSNGNIFLAIYRYMPEIKFKEVSDAIYELRKQLGVHAHNPEPIPDECVIHQSQEVKGNNITAALTDKDGVGNDGDNKPDELTVKMNGIYDMNNFACPDCGSQDMDDIKISGWEITKQCNSCGIQFQMIPSRFYIIKSRITYTKFNANALNLSEEV